MYLMPRILYKVLEIDNYWIAIGHAFIAYVLLIQGIWDMDICWMLGAWIIDLLYELYDYICVINLAI